MMDDIAAEYSRLINEQSDETLLSIIDNFSLNDLFYCNVQHGARWEQLKKLIFAQKNILILLPNSETVDSFAKFYHDYCFPDDAENVDKVIIKNGGIIASDWLDSVKKPLYENFLFLKNNDDKIDSISSLTKCFTNLKCLVLYQCPVRTGEIQTLLSAAIPSLDSLVLQFPEPSKIDWSSIWSVIDMGGNLKSLCIFNCDSQPITLPNVLPQLESLSIGLYKGELFQTLIQLTPARFKRLALIQIGESLSVAEIVQHPKMRDDFLKKTLAHHENVGTFTDPAFLNFLNRLTIYTPSLLSFVFDDKPELIRNMSHLIMDHYEYGGHGFTGRHFDMLMKRNFVNGNGIRVFGFYSQFGIDQLVIHNKTLSNVAELRLASSIDLFAGVHDKQPEPMKTIRSLQIDVDTISLRSFARAILYFPNVERLIFAREMKIACPIEDDDCSFCIIEFRKLLLAFPLLLSPKCPPLTKEDEEIYVANSLHLKIEWSYLNIPEPKFVVNEKNKKTRKLLKKGVGFPQKMKTKNINELDDDSLKLILDIVSLNDLLGSCQFVCHRWTSVTSTVCKQKTTLKLVEYTAHARSQGSREELIAYWHFLHPSLNVWKEPAEMHRRFCTQHFRQSCESLCTYNASLALPRFDTRICHKLCRTFPNIKHLHLGALMISADDLLILITAWAARLETLSIVSPAAYDVSLFQYRLDLQAIIPQMDVSLSRIRKLELSSIFGPLKLPKVFAQLEELYLGTYEFGNLFNVLSSIDDTRLKRLRVCHQERTKVMYEMTFMYVAQHPHLMEGLTPLDDPDYTFNVMQRVMKLKPKLCNNLTHLALSCDSHGDDGIGANFVEFICDNFHALVSLSVQVAIAIDMKELCFQLNKLKHLTELHLTSDNLDLFKAFPIGESDVARYRLPSVTSLTFMAPFVGGKFAKLHQVMPNLRYIYFLGPVICAQTGQEIHGDTGFWQHLNILCQPCNRELHVAYDAFPRLAPVDKKTAGVDTNFLFQCFNRMKG